ncbi:hypothetical protein [Apilactobacillus xinyiensis]|uniref:hypothetical protein n=1 Tax=Apilactobacillus xinyiensis TaxID=2841032 RepID=UPI00200DA9AC|nr:hypothetical protein [Apilactobacillus xinyiensis]MCL0319299.1 hypothetical protein [Apilactobacillus xinyiensis]
MKCLKYLFLVITFSLVLMFSINVQANLFVKQSNERANDTTQLSNYEKNIMEKYNIDIDKSTERKNKYKLLWRKNIPNKPVYLTSVDSLYSQDFLTRYYYGKDSSYLYGIPYNAVEEEAVHNKEDNNNYIFYKLAKNTNMPYSAWVLNYGTVFEQSMPKATYEKMLATITNAKLDKTLQKGAYIAARHFVDGNTSEDSLAEDYQDAIYQNIRVDNYGQKIINPNADAYSKRQFQLLNNRKIRYITYFKRMFQHQIKDLNTCGNKVGIYAYPSSSALYGRIVLFYIHK